MSIVGLNEVLVHKVGIRRKRRSGQILKCIKLSIILCGNLGIALRGHREDDGNFSTDNRLLRNYLVKKETEKSTRTLKFRFS
ncbi:hypothetical protein MAR_012239 [Mya arenaria]|uniref:DUF4371 domain-containing protein n=1 Tax=Mya arenaria TaxID=6604 RepID=A0ABY7FX11_MYAAR|nr:hypothetical protein MAR_012239 [Mya arenaria]